LVSFITRVGRSSHAQRRNFVFHLSRCRPEQRASTPASIEGWWRGSGIVTYRNGADNVQCRVRYTRLTAKTFRVSSQCATESGRYELTGRVVNVGGNRYTGWVQSTQEIKAAGFARPALAIAFRSR
jgi:hypothetical protein